MDFMNGRKQFLNSNLHGIGANLKHLARAFNTFQIFHIYREKNDYVDALSKEGLLLATRSITYTRKKNGDCNQYNHIGVHVKMKKIYKLMVLYLARQAADHAISLLQTLPRALVQCNMKMVNWQVQSIYILLGCRLLQMLK